MKHTGFIEIYGIDAGELHTTTKITFVFFKLKLLPGREKGGFMMKNHLKPMGVRDVLDSTLFRGAAGVNNCCAGIKCHF
jgi:hypothetical protein